MSNPRDDVSDNLLWAAVYGAAFARQALDWIDEGHGPGDDDDNDRWHGEACSVADTAIAARAREAAETAERAAGGAS